ncbi:MULTISPECIES: efflux RND transporter periplasmic adaptor subunit [Carnobacterium]|nr:efflux RND transporter periplasmic adaptor subunit [Carnobacterium maltaromaticum]MBC9788248.1 HlyD family efflux transporter periplasmic adaptor subunit [Carnobacterium maltaromaticum]TFJ70607.1 hypothetical protein CKN94_15415 [Carnobacterium maltaromaticum]TFJ76177.1 hypothetical protein CKN97_15405 [Carnobacterium maltaromaticum]
MKKKKPIKLISSVVIVLAIIAGSIFYFTRSQSNANSLSQKLIPQTVKELSGDGNKGSNFLLTGSVAPNQISKLTLDNSKGTVSEVHVKEGDSVVKGQKLYTYQNPDGELALKEAQLTVTNQANDLEQKRSDASLKWEQHNKKQADLDKLTTKYNQAGAEEKETLKQEKTQLETEVAQAKSDARTADSLIGTAEIELEKAQLGVTNAEKKYGSNDVLAEVDGVVKKVDTDQMNKSVAEGNKETFMEITDTSSLYVNGQVDEFNKDQLAIDQPVKIIDRTDEKKVWSGKISKVGNLAAESGGDDEKKEEENPNLSKYPFKVIFDPTDTPPPLGRHMYVEVLPKGDEANKVKLPLDFVIQEGKESYVWLVKKGKIEKSKIEAGEPDKETNTVEITKGLTEEDQIVYPYSTLKAGMEVGSDVKIN